MCATSMNSYLVGHQHFEKRVIKVQRGVANSLTRSEKKACEGLLIEEVETESENEKRR